MLSKTFQRWAHKLFNCPTFWRIKPFFRCPGCGAGFRCYWDGHDVLGVGKDYCAKCENELSPFRLDSKS